ncbi:MAG: tRNA epoxyqueuosine(34) reductase QueG [Cytophagaceae bacterium SCN 52-12]|mgnify:CR=1 FL=1|nr:MAG: tRNA epoxyqueuosine(34) reductase QueG [Cytophagaceae bacterium SCN 52-12]
MTVQDIIAEERSSKVKELAAIAGFDACGISKAGFLEEEAPRLEKWLHEGKNGAMQWMENHFDKRLDPTKLVEGARSVISVVLNYYPENKLPEEASDYKISKYAYGEDYHFVLKDKLKHLAELLRENFGDVNGRAFVDSAPVMDKVWAKRAGLGWVGKHSNLVNPRAGSFFFIGELIVDLELRPDESIRDFCGTCTRCIDACPTDAIESPYEVNGSKCISYYTIELKEAIPDNVKGKFENWIFGCDICQDVCPWNRFSKPHREPLFHLKPELESLKKGDWEEITEEVFREVFRRSPVKRTRLEGLKRNISFIKEAVTPSPVTIFPDS